MGDHAYWNPSGIASALLCAGQKALEQGRPNLANEHAASGTASHQVLTWALQRGKDASDWVGITIDLDAQGKVLPPVRPNGVVTEYSFKVDDERAERVQLCIDYVRNLMSQDSAAVLLVDKRVNHAARIGVPTDQGFGTLDVAVILPTLRKAYFIDYKDGRGYVSAGNAIDGPNPQVACYAIGAVDMLSIAHDFDDFELVLTIVQPRCSQVPEEHSMTLPELEAWFDTVAKPAITRSRVAVDTYRPNGDAVIRLEWEETFLTPGESQCQYCLAKSTCPALRDDVTETVFGAPMASADDFATLTETTTLQHVEGGSVELWDGNVISSAAWVGAALSKVDQIEDWCKGIRTEAERLMLSGVDVPGHKLVAGKQGNREWVDAEQASESLKTMRLKVEEMYDLKLISPTSAEKLAKAGTIGPRQWAKLQTLIKRKPGKPHVAPLTDGRPALPRPNAAGDFDVIDVQATEVRDASDFA